MAAIAGIGSQLALAANTRPILTVYLLDESVAPSLVIIVARAQAGKMFTAAGISIQWHSGKPRLPQADNALVIQMKERTPEDFYPGSLALAMPYEGAHIQIFYQRIQEAVSPDTRPALLAHVLVHEITHMLQGINRHSEEGIMKAYWDPNDYHRMQSKPLAFTQNDIDLIQRGLTARAARSNKLNLVTEKHEPVTLR
jgi:hypothetical protein